LLAQRQKIKAIFGPAAPGVLHESPRSAIATDRNPIAQPVADTPNPWDFPAKQPAARSAQGTPVLQRQIDWQPGPDYTAAERDDALGIASDTDRVTPNPGAQAPQDEPGFLAEPLAQNHAVSVDGEDHHLFAQLRGGELQLAIASDPTVLHEFLKSREGTRLSDKSRNRLIWVAAQLNNIYSDWKKNLGRALNQILESIALRLQKASKGAVTLPQSNVTWPSTTETEIARSGGVSKFVAGTDMIAHPLSIRPPPGIHGQQPASPGIGSGLIWGHLLNHKLHGPNAHENLMPISTGLNGKMENDFESVVKKAVLGQNKIVRYRVQMTDLQSATSVSKYANKIAFELQELEWNGLTWTAKANQPPEFAAVHGKTLQPKRDPHAHTESKVPVSFGHERHTLMVQVHDGIPRLMIASDPELILEFLNGPGGKALDPETFKAIDLLAGRYDQILSGYKNDLGKVVKTYLAIAADAIVSSSQNPIPLPATKVQWTTIASTLGTVGKTMNANPLSLRPGDTVGSEPSQERIRSSFVWGHLLNHKLHGPADLKNLAPITASFNQRMERTIETAAKKAVLGQGKVIHYGVAVTDSEQVDEIDYVPTSMRVTLQELRPRTVRNKTTWIPRATAQQPPELEKWDATDLTDKSELMEALEDYM